MKITKIGHCCLLVEESGVTLLTDPGSFSTGQNDVRGIHAVLITHEHTDHFHVDSLKTVLHNNPEARIITNTAVHTLLEKESIPSEIIGNGQSADVNGLLVEGYGTEHGKVSGNEPAVENTGYFVGSKLFYPGDALYNPGKKAAVLALPVSGPWVNMREALLYAQEMAPEMVFPVHEGLLNEAGVAITYRWGAALEKMGIRFVPMHAGSIENF